MAGRSLGPFALHGCSAIYLLLAEPQLGAGTQALAKCLCYQGNHGFLFITLVLLFSFKNALMITGGSLSAQAFCKTSSK